MRAGEWHVDDDEQGGEDGSGCLWMFWGIYFDVEAVVDDAISGHKRRFATKTRRATLFVCLAWGFSQYFQGCRVPMTKGSRVALG
jgi:hypothetical protein